MSACFSSFLGKFTIKQANIVGDLAEVFTNNQAKNIKKISDEIGKNLKLSIKVSQRIIKLRAGLGSYN